MWREEGWAGLARRIGARLTPPPPPDPFAPRVAQGLPRPELITLGGRTLEGFAAELRLPAVSEPVVSVVIPALDKLAYTLCCLASLCRHAPATSFEVIVVDDGSTDETPAVLPRVPNLACIRHETNQGFVGSINRGAGAARGRFLLLLNNDTQAQPGWLDELVAAFDDPAVGIAGSKLVYPSGHLQEAGAVLRADGTVELVGLDDDPARSEYNVRREVDHCSGACLMIRRELFLELGGLDEAYAPAYFEDCDLSLRVRGRGLKVVYVPTSVVVHHLSVTTAGAGEAVKQRQVETNRRLLLERWGGVLARAERVRAIAFEPYPSPAAAGALATRGEVASRHGVSGFCYSCDQKEEAGLVDRLEGLDFPFCIRLLNEETAGRSIERLLACLRHPGYVRLNGRPLVLLDGAAALRFPEAWRHACRRAGVGEPYLARVQGAEADGADDPRERGFDAAVELPVQKRVSRPSDPAQAAASFATRRLPAWPLFRTVMAGAEGWGPPDVYRRWLQAMVRQTRQLRHGDERIVFIGGWDVYLEATAQALAPAAPA